MKKVLLVALMLGASVAFASSLCVPWFVDNAPVGAGYPPQLKGTMTLVYLHNNTAADITCTIAYFTSSGVSIGPAAPDNTFVVPIASSVGFRPVRYDPSTSPGGQESSVAVAIPDRPMGTEGGNDNKKNGSIKIEWAGANTDIQGMVTMVGVQNMPLDITNPTGPKGTLMNQYGHLLPPGA